MEGKTEYTTEKALGDAEPTVFDEAYAEDVYNHVMDDYNAVKQGFDERSEYEKYYNDFAFGRQWTEEEVQAHLEQGRYPFVINETKNIINHMCGTQAQTRMDTKAVGREKGDESASQLLTYLLKWVEQINDFDAIESKVFKKGVIRGRSAAVVRWHTEEVPYGYPKIELVPEHELYWDVNSRTDNLSDARYIMRVRKIEKRELIEYFPDKYEEIKNASQYSRITWAADAVATHKEDMFGATRYLYEKDLRESIKVIEHYEKINIREYIVYDDVSGERKSFSSRKDADAFMRGLSNGYAEDGVVLVNADGSKKVYDIVVSVPKVLLTVIAGQVVLCHELTDLPFFPYILYFPDFDEGEWAGVVEDLLSLQIIVNRGFSHWDYLLGTALKNVMLVNENKLPDGWTIEDVRRERSRMAPTISVNDTNGTINVLPNPNFPPELLQEVQFAITRLFDKAGGKNVMGITENAAESGRAVIARAEQGGVGRLPFFDSLRNWKKEVMLRVVWYLKNCMMPGQIARLIGTDEDIFYIELDDQIVRTLREIKADIIVDEAIRSEAIRERNFQQITQMFQQTQVPQEIILPLMLEYSTIPENKKEEIRNMLESYQKYITEKAKMENQQKVTKEAEDAVLRAKLKEEMTRGDKLKEAKQAIATKEKDVQTRIKNLRELKFKEAQEEKRYLQQQ